MSQFNPDDVVRCENCQELVRRPGRLEYRSPESWAEVMDAQYLELSTGDVLCPHCRVAQVAGAQSGLVRLDQRWKQTNWAGIPAFLAIKLPDQSENELDFLDMSIYYGGFSLEKGR